MFAIDETGQTIADLTSAYPKYAYRLDNEGWLEVTCEYERIVSDSPYELIRMNEGSKNFRVRRSSAEWVADFALRQGDDPAAQALRHLSDINASTTGARCPSEPAQGQSDMDGIVAEMACSHRKTASGYEFSFAHHRLTLTTTDELWILSCALDLDRQPLVASQVEALSLYLLAASEEIRVVKPVLSRNDNGWKPLLEVCGLLPVDEWQLSHGIGSINTFYTRHIAQVRAILTSESLADLYLKKRSTPNATTRRSNTGTYGA